MFIGNVFRPQWGPKVVHRILSSQGEPKGNVKKSFLGMTPDMSGANTSNIPLSFRFLVDEETIYGSLVYVSCQMSNPSMAACALIIAPLRAEGRLINIFDTFADLA
jgi:hypothetical protein